MHPQDWRIRLSTVAAAMAITAATVACCGLIAPTVLAQPAHPTGVHKVATAARRKVIDFRVHRARRGIMAVPNGHPTVVFFMSAQCGSCAAGEHQLANLRGMVPRRVRFLSLDVAPGYDTPAMVLALAHSVDAHWPQAYATAAILHRYHITALDEVVVINARGGVRYDGALPSNARLLRAIRQAEA